MDTVIGASTTPRRNVLRKNWFDNGDDDRNDGVHLVIDFVTGEHVPDTAMLELEPRRVFLPLPKQLFVDLLVGEQSTSEGMHLVEFRGIPVARSHSLLIGPELDGIELSPAVTELN